MDLHRHPGLDLEGIRVGTGGHRHGLFADHRDRRLHVRLLVPVITIEITAEVEPLAVELLKRGRELERKSDDLIRSQLLFERGARLGTVVHDTGCITPIITVGRTVVPRIGIVKHLHADALDRLGSLHGGHIDEPIADFLEGDIDHLAPVAPSAPHGIRKIVVRVGDYLGSQRSRPQVMQARPQGQTQPHEDCQPDSDTNPLHRCSPPALLSRTSWWPP